MNEENRSLQDEIGNLIKKEIPSISEHPLHMLDNQADPLTKPKNVIQKPIRTYESDLAEVFSKKNTSVMKIAIAENKRSENTNSEIIGSNNEQKPNNSKKYFLLIISLILIISGIGGGYYLYLKSPLSLKSIKSVVIKDSGLINIENHNTFLIRDLKGNILAQNIAELIKNNEKSSDKFNEYIISDRIGSTTRKISASKFIELLNIQTPDILNRSLKDDWIFGIHSKDYNNSPFIIFKSDFFQNSYAGMLKWEITMPDDLALLLNYKDIARLNSFLDTGTSTISSYFTIRGAFTDKIILNRDVREFINENNQLLLLYSFIDKDTLIITTSEDTLKSIINRIEKQTYIR